MRGLGSCGTPRSTGCRHDRAHRHRTARVPPERCCVVDGYDRYTREWRSTELAAGEDEHANVRHPVPDDDAG